MLSVVVPFYNEQETVVSTVRGIIDELEGFVEYEIIAVNDGSTDCSLERLTEAGLPRVKVLSHVENSGYGNSLFDGIVAAQYENIAIIDADGTYPVKHLRLLLSHLPAYDMVVGARTGKQSTRGIFKHPARRLFRFLAQYAAGQSIPDVNSGLRVFKRDVVLSFRDFLSPGFSFTTSLTLLLLLNSYYVKYVPIDYLERSKKSRSKVSPIRDTLRAGQIILTTILHYNPIKLFLLLATANLAAGVFLALVRLVVLQSLILEVAAAIMISSFVPVFGLGLLAEQVRKPSAPSRRRASVD